MTRLTNFHIFPEKNPLQLFKFPLPLWADYIEFSSSSADQQGKKKNFSEILWVQSGRPRVRTRQGKVIKQPKLTDVKNIRKSEIWDNQLTVINENCLVFTLTWLISKTDIIWNVINAWMHPYVQPWIMFLDFVCFYLSKLLLPSLQYLLVNAEINCSHTLKK